MSWGTCPPRPACSSPGSCERNPRAIAEELAGAFERPGSVRDVQVQGAGFLNFFLDRRAFAAALLEAPLLGGGGDRGGRGSRSGKVIIEHTNINPNKAAHIGHLRNAVLGDVLGRAAARAWAFR